jgi:hypothetical protein
MTEEGGPMESMLRKLRIHSLRTKIETSRLRSVELAGRFESAETNAQKTRIVREYDKSLKRIHAMQFQLEMLERNRVDSHSKAGS